jgi:hypothetical protein
MTDAVMRDSPGNALLADGSYVKQMVIGTLLGSWRRW